MSTNNDDGNILGQLFVTIVIIAAIILWMNLGPAY